MEEYIKKDVINEFFGNSSPIVSIAILFELHSLEIENVIIDDLMDRTGLIKDLAKNAMIVRNISNVKKEKSTGIIELTKTDVNEKGAKHDNGKPRWDLVILSVVAGIAKVLTFGANKYSANSWQKVEDAERRYFAALMRHLTAYQSGENEDPESGLSHLDHAACNIMFLRHFEKTNKS